MGKIKYSYDTIGVCCKEMSITLNEDNSISDIKFVGGCPGNLAALRKVMLNKPYTEFLGTFEGIKCGNKATSCMHVYDLMLKLIDEDIKGVQEYPFKKEFI